MNKILNILLISLIVCLSIVGILIYTEEPPKQEQPITAPDLYLSVSLDNITASVISTYPIPRGILSDTALISMKCEYDKGEYYYTMDNIEETILKILKANIAANLTSNTGNLVEATDITILDYNFTKDAIVKVDGLSFEVGITISDSVRLNKLTTKNATFIYSDKKLEIILE